MFMSKTLADHPDSSRIWQVALLTVWIPSILISATISGYVADAETGETIIGVNVIVEGTELGASTDLNGFFVVGGIPAGEVAIKFSHIAYEERIETMTIGSADRLLETVMLTPTTLEAEAIEVVANRGNIIKKETDISSFEVDPVVLREVPQLGKDVFQLVKFSPSVTIADEFSPLYNVRGSDPSENLVQLDGMTIYNPQHLFGYGAIFNPLMIKNIEMLVGGFDAEYGGRNASILYLTSREGHQSEVHGEFRPSISGFVGAVEFPAGDGGTAMLSGRLTSDLVSRVMVGMGNFWGDFNGSYQRKIGNTRLKLSAFLARDFIDFDAARYAIYFDLPELRDYSVGNRTNALNRAVGLRTRSIVTPKLVLETHLYSSAFDVGNRTFLRVAMEDTINNIDVTLMNETAIRNAISDLTVKANISYFTFWGQTLKVGLESNDYRFSNRASLQFTEGIETRDSARLLSFFVQDQIQLGPLLAKGGVRAARFSPDSDWRTEPRLSSSLRLGRITLKTAWGQYRQYLSSMNTADVEVTPQSVDYYYPLKGMTPLTSEHSILGLEGRLSDDLEVTVTGYRKELPTLYRYDFGNTRQAILSHAALLERGRGRAKGVETMVKGEVGRVSGWVAYAYSVAERSYPGLQGGRWHLSNGDQTHTLKSLLMLKVTPDITASTTLQLTSGFPKTFETGWLSKFTYDPLSNSMGAFYHYLTPAKNNVRFPWRTYLELGWKKKLRTGFGYRLSEYLGAGESYLTWTVRNILFLRRNPFAYFYIPDYGYYAYGIFSLPSVSAGYSIKF